MQSTDEKSCTTDDTLPEMLLLGAGTSVEVGVPHALGMTEAIAKRFREQPRDKKHAEVISFVIGGLLFQHGIRGKNPLQEGVNVDELFNAVRLLAERRTPFLGSRPVRWLLASN